MTDKQDICSMSPSELEGIFRSAGEKPYRARQVFKWLHSGAASFSEMTDIPAALREKLATEFYITAPALMRKQVSKQDGTIKYLWGMDGGCAVESVIMEYEHGNTVCISTQSGCRMGCVFCASQLGGFFRNLVPSEMEAQVQYSQQDSGKKISNIVLMGIGEPLDNFDNVLRFLNLINHPDGMNIGMRHISLSTCGIIENIDKLAEYDIKLTLSVSLHAPDDETRSRLMPINRTTGVDRLMQACGRYFQKTGRRVSYEYALIDGINDTLPHAQMLASKLKNTGSHLNIILLSDVPELPLQASSTENTGAFTEYLKQKGVNYTIRRSLGSDIDASCGQLRRKIFHGTMGYN